MAGRMKTMIGFAKNLAALTNANSPEVLSIARLMIEQYPERYSIGRLCMLWDFLRDSFTYEAQKQEGYPMTAKASDIIRRGFRGDCDDMSILGCAGIEAIGGTSRHLIACTRSRSVCHAYPECYIGSVEYAKERIIPYIQERYGLSKKDQDGAFGQISCHLENRGQLWLNFEFRSWAKYPGSFIYMANQEFAGYRNGQVEAINWYG